MKYYRGGKNDNTDFTALEFVFFLLKNLSNKHIAKAKILLERSCVLFFRTVFKRKSIHKPIEVTLE